MRERIINLTFHGIGDPERRLEPGEAQVWVDADQFQSVLDAVVGRDDVRITFDDGNASDVEHALPALRERGLTATFFVVAGRLGEPGFLDARRRPRARRRRHGASAPTACATAPGGGSTTRALEEELVDAKACSRSVVERPVTEAACPFGSYDRRVLRALRAAGYRRVYTSDRGTTRPGDLLQARNTVGPGTPRDRLERDPRPGDGPRMRVLRRRAKLAAKRWR